MILRAMFFMAVVAILMPHEPNLGLGRPSANVSAASMLSVVSSVVAPSRESCADRAVECAAASAASGRLQAAAVQSLGQIKAELDAERAKRRAAGSFL
ncbi:MAG TPA: hypothetical protein VG309_10600 [Rhizomicrobium sp.]|nr:hypothetical protein [Rhizomicrobium sp.]